MSLIENNSSFDPRELRPAFSLRGDFGSPMKGHNATITQMPKGPMKTRPKSPILPDVIYSSAISTSPHPPDNSKKVSSNISVINDDEDASNPYKKPPKVSRRLPAAFAQGMQKVSSNIIKKPSLTNLEKYDVFTNLEQLIEVQESKSTSNLLSPLKMQKSPTKVENKFAKHPEEVKSSRNPLLPLKSYLLMAKQNEEGKENIFTDLSTDRLDLNYRSLKENNPIISYRRDVQLPKVSEMITIGIIKPGNETGAVKKMIHAPTLKLYAVKEIPMNTKEMRNNMKDWVTQWQTTLGSSTKHLKILNAQYNTPEGCVSVIMELMTGGSLENLLESVGNLPETALRSICQQTLEALEDVHMKLNAPHGMLSPSQILLDKNGKVRLSPGLYNKSAIHSSNHNFINTSARNNFEKLSLYEINPMNSPSIFHQRSLVGSKEFQNKFEAEKLPFQKDVFELGFMMLISAVGGLDFFEASEFTEKLKLFLDDLSKRPQERNKYCCIIHNEDLIASVKAMNSEFNRPMKVMKSSSIIYDKTPKSAMHISIQDFLKTKNFSTEFTDFLCGCLKFDPAKRTTVKALLKSAFITGTNLKGPNTTLAELMKISLQWTKNYVLPTEYQAASENQLNKMCSALNTLLPSCEKLSLYNLSELDNLSSSSVVIQDLAADLGLPAGKVFDKIDELIKSLASQNKISTI